MAKVRIINNVFERGELKHRVGDEIDLNAIATATYKRRGWAVDAPADTESSELKKEKGGKGSGGK